MTCRIALNGTPVEVPEGQSLAELLQAQGYIAEHIAVACGEEVIRRQEWQRPVADLIAAAGSTDLEILTAVQGG